MKRTILLVLLLAYGTVAYPESIPLKREGGTFVVPVLINDKITLNLTIDSGAADVSIPADVFSTLVRAETVTKSDLIDTQVYQLADGSEQSSQIFRIRSLRVGSLELRDVIASVAPAAGSLLLGQSVLSRIKSWSIDNDLHLLLFNESPTGGGVGATPEQPTATPQASNWVPLALTGNGKGAIAIDESSIRITGSTRRAWVKTVYMPHTMRGWGTHAGTWIDSGLVHILIDCSQETVRLDSMTGRCDDGTSISLPQEALLPWQPVTTDTLAGVVMGFICAWKPK